jgi:hypothetical protein
LDVGSVGEEDIQVSVVIEVEDCHTPFHGFGRMAPVGLAAVDAEIDSTGTRN